MVVIYFVLKFMVRVTLRVFYKEFSVSGRERIPKKGPLIMVANHPNTLMDPLVVGSILKQQAGFLGNGSLFRNKSLGAFLSYFNVIPVYRKQDIRPGEQIDNLDSFKHAREYLGKGGTLLIFPEGTSFAEKKMREIRTGAARIALSYEQSKGFKGGLVLMPAALNYTKSTVPRTRLRVDVGTPIHASDYKEAFEKDEVAAVEALTDAIGRQIEERMVVLPDKPLERTHWQILRLTRDAKQPKRGRHALDTERNLAKRIRTLKEEDPKLLGQLQLHLEQWYKMMDRLDIHPGFFKAAFKRWNPVLLAFLLGLGLLAGLPVFAAGLLTNWLPYWFPAWVAPRLSDEIEYHTPTMMAMSMFFFPIWYGILLSVAWLTMDLSLWWVLTLLAALPTTGAFALLYRDLWERFLALLGLLRIQSRKKTLVDRLAAERHALLTEINQALGSWR